MTEPDPTPWQHGAEARLRALPGVRQVEPYGSSLDGTDDAWSDLDAVVHVAGDLAVRDLDGAALWAWEDHDADGAQVLRTVLTDGRRIDLRVLGGRLLPPPAPADLQVRFDLALAAARLGRGDELIGRHLLLGVLRECLVLAMRRRDRDAGTVHHRHGGDLDVLAREVTAIGDLPHDLSARPHPTERAAHLHASWLRALEPGHRGDWSGLTALLDRGSRGRRP